MFWSSSQNLANPQSFNSYSYAEGNPITLKDPSGLATVKGSLKETQKELIKVLKSYISLLKSAKSNPKETVRSIGRSAGNSAKNFVLNPGGVTYDAVVSARNNINTYRNGSHAVQDKMIGSGVAGVAGLLLPKGLKRMPGDSVISETLGGRGDIRSTSRLSSTDALTTGEQFLGPNYMQLGKPDSGVFRSADGLRQFRIDNGSIDGPRPHVSFEAYQLGQTTKPYVNNHVYLID